MSVPASFVLDASVTATWLLPEAHTPASRRLYAQLRKQTVECHAPNLWLWECGNILANGVKRSRIAPLDTQALWVVLDAVRTRLALHELEPAQMKAALALGLDHRLSLYDAGYLWLALSLRLPLLTLDDRLAAAARAQKVPVVALDDF